MRVTINAKDRVNNISMKSFNYNLDNDNDVNRFINKLKYYFDLCFDIIEIEKDN